MISVGGSESRPAGVGKGGRTGGNFLAKKKKGQKQSAKENERRRVKSGLHRKRQGVTWGERADSNTPEIS